MNEQKEPNQKPTREMMIYYTPMYNLIVQSKMLSQTERTLVVLIASYQGLGCNWARESLKDYCESGPYHLDRAIKRLQFMHIIRVLPGPPRRDGSKRREKNRYIFEPDPYNWRVTKDIQELIIQETLAMKKEPRLFFRDAFPNDLGLEIAFAKTFPKYANGKKGRKKKASDPAAGTEESVTEESSKMWEEKPIESESTKWLKRFLTVTDENVRFTYLASEYYLCLRDIKRVRENPDHRFSQHKVNYLERLHHLYADKCMSLKPDELEVHKEIDQWLADGLSPIDIFSKLSKLDIEAKVSQEEQNSTLAKES